MAIHPLGLLNWENGGRERAIIEATVAKLEACGPRWWTGYSYAWFANMKARIRDGEGAARALRDFAESFCLPNTFHANGDQSGRGKSDYDYRPFTLEGNFAFAASVQEMLLQSHTGIIRVFPAVPDSWQDVSFRNLRAQGAFLVSAEKRDGRVVSVEIRSEKGGELQLCFFFFPPPSTDELSACRPPRTRSSACRRIRSRRRVRVGNPCRVNQPYGFPKKRPVPQGTERFSSVAAGSRIGLPLPDARSWAGRRQRLHFGDTPLLVYGFRRCMDIGKCR